MTQKPFLISNGKSNILYIIQQGLSYEKHAQVRCISGSSLTACTGNIENKNKTCSYDYLLHPAISISKMIGGCGPAADQK